MNSERANKYPIPALMFQGVASGVGKSLISAGFCRLLANRGYRVVPFKAQNMSLNSRATPDGAEIGRAQDLQARAARIVADARMNPVLLKPMGEKGMQVIVLGKPIGVMTYKEYVAEKNEIWRVARDAYRSLTGDADLAIIEGAGSPAEINLREHDLANSRAAREAGAAVVLIADIDKGGAFASLLGTFALLYPSDRARIMGFLLNKFRGDASLLSPAIAEISRRCARPFLGVAPMIPDLSLPEEDSLGFKEKALAARRSALVPDEGKLDIVAVNFPSISNFTDLDPFLVEPDVSLRVVSRGREFGRPDVVILPGSRDVGRDLRFLDESGLAAQILAYAAGIRAGASGRLIGVCGGLQALCESLEDPGRLESDGRLTCLGLLPATTVLLADKIVRARRALCVFPGFVAPVSGYEIHHGVTTGAAPVCVEGEDGSALGYAAPDAPGKIWGTYLHGVFDNDQFRRELLEEARREKNLPSRPPSRYDPDAGLDELAAVLEEHTDIDKILATLTKGYRRGEGWLWRNAARRGRARSLR